MLQTLFRILFEGKLLTEHFVVTRLMKNVLSDKKDNIRENRTAEL